MIKHKFVSNCRVPGCTSAHYFCQVPDCGVPATDSIHQQESQQCGSCAGNLPNHEEGCFYKLAQEIQPELHKLLMELKWQHDNTSDHTDRAIIDCKMEQLIADEAPEGLRAVEAFYKGQIAQAQQRIAELEKELAGYKEEPCPKQYSGHFFDAEGNCIYCDKYDEENNLRLKARSK